MCTIYQLIGRWHALNTVTADRTAAAIEYDRKLSLRASLWSNPQIEETGMATYASTLRAKYSIPPISPMSTTLQVPLLLLALPLGGAVTFQ